MDFQTPLSRRSQLLRSAVLVPVALVLSLTTSAPTWAEPSRPLTGLSVALLEPPATPVLLKLSRDHDHTRGGDTVKITGLNFTGATAVDFGATPASNFSVRSADEILATDPSATGVVDVTVTTPGGVSPATPADMFTYIGKPPVVSSISPKEGPTAGGTAVGIGGRNFLGASAVDFGSTPAASFTVDSDGSITAISPPETVSRVNITVTTPYGTSQILPCHYQRAEEEEIIECVPHGRYKFREATVSSVDPILGTTGGGTTVTLTGSGFAPGTGETEVRFGKLAASSVRCASTTICTAVSPAHEAGTEFVTVRIPKSNLVKKVSKDNPAAVFTFG